MLIGYKRKMCFRIKNGSESNEIVSIFKFWYQTNKLSFKNYNIQ